MGPERRKTLWLWALGGLAALGVIAVLYGVLSGGPNPHRDGYRQYANGAMRALVVRDDPPALSTRALEGAAPNLGAYRGRVLLVNLWATWCGPCREEMPTLARLQNMYRDRGLVVAPVSVDGATQREAAHEMLRELAGDALPFLIDPTRAIAFDLSAEGFPTSILYDREGRELARLSGRADWSSREARALIEAALSEG